MERSVDDVIGKLSEIEAAAVRIREASDVKKKKLSEQMEKEVKAFDEKLSVETENKLKEIQEKLNSEKEEELQKQKAETEKLLSAMQLKYDSDKEAWAESIMQSIVRM